MGVLTAIRERLRRYPPPSDLAAVRRMTAAQWAGIARRTPTYMAGYRDQPGSEDRGQRRAEWLAAQPVFAEVTSVLELGCGCGRNLAALRRRRLLDCVMGVDICPEAVNEARRILPGGYFAVADLYDGAPLLPHADVIFTIGVLGHLEREAMVRLVHNACLVARQAVVLVEEPGVGSSLAKGPRAWGAAKDTQDYVLWLHDFESLFRSRLRLMQGLPADLQAPGATTLFMLRPGA